MGESRLEVRAASLDDAGMVADLETTCLPDEPRDAAMVAFWWTHQPGQERFIRLVGEQGGVIKLFVGAGHSAWEPGARRYGRLRVLLHPDSWSGDAYRQAIDRAESWLRSEGVEVSVTKVSEDLSHDVSVLAGLGYVEARRHRHWELDLVAHRDRLLATAERARANMRDQGIDLVTVDRDPDPDVLRKVYKLDLVATDDVPTTAPFPVPSYEEWLGLYFDNPGIRKDRFWIARIGDEVAAMSLIEFPPGRGVPATEFTGTSPRFRGRGIARALSTRRWLRPSSWGQRACGPTTTPPTRPSSTSTTRWATAPPRPTSSSTAT